MSAHMSGVIDLKASSEQRTAVAVSKRSEGRMGQPKDTPGASTPCVVTSRLPVPEMT